MSKQPYPWSETVRCATCRRLYRADYTQDRDWGLCPDCTGEAGKPARRVFDPATRTWREPRPKE
jgi:hypothetical protein